MSTAQHNARLLLLAAIIAGAIAATYGITAVRAVPPGPGEVLFCVNSYTGAVRLGADTDLCFNGEVVTVNQEGPPGPQGIQGPQGAQGSAGTTDTIIRDTIDAAIAPGVAHETVASCQAGEVATGGGYFSTSINTVLSALRRTSRGSR